MEGVAPNLGVWLIGSFYECRFFQAVFDSRN